MEIRFESSGIAEAEASLQTLSNIRLEAVMKATLASIYTRALQPGGTPVDTGELRLSASVDNSALEFGYVKEYAPHVEYGHRTVNGGYVEGQHYLQQNVATEEPLFLGRLDDQIRQVLE